MRKRTPFLIFWPQYFDAKRTRSEGRRLPENLAIEKVTIKDLAIAAKSLGYQIQIESSLKYPKSWWEESGRVLINTKGKKKSKVLKEIAKEIRKTRGKS
ncbi:MAG: Signal recognition particle 19 kDa protein [Promethearchaeota archaeon]|jgi:signal recognition particle subunit SRP19|nr:MAG: Signal recognition particle 19 kDa protein [Candidatus Lokiarchaeota archaeon]